MSPNVVKSAPKVNQKTALGDFHRRLSIDYRGYAWGTGQPSLKKLCSDADQCFRASQKLLADAEISKVQRSNCDECSSMLFLFADLAPLQ